MTYIPADTLDDLMRGVFELLLKDGTDVTSTKGFHREVFGTLLELTNPRARLSQSVTRGKVASCLGELCWYLSMRNDEEYITYYIKPYHHVAESGIIHGGYGPRLYNWAGHNQIGIVVDTLERKPSSRQAVVQLFDKGDLVGDHKDVPCTCTLQFVIREGRLSLMVFMRSNDAYKGLPHDIFCFTMIQEIVARTLGMELGSYKHAVGSLHFYHTEREKIDDFLSEGWQQKLAMPAMPIGDPGPAIGTLLQAERAFRKGVAAQDLTTRVNGLDPYWRDLSLLLEAHSMRKQGLDDRVRVLADDLTSQLYRDILLSWKTGAH